MTERRVVTVLGALVALLLPCIGARLGAAPGVRIIRQPRIVLHIQPLSSSGQLRSSPPAPHRLAVDHRGKSALEFDLAWADDASGVRVRLTAEEREVASGSRHAVSLEAEVRFADGQRATASRAHAFDEDSTFLFELHRGHRPLVLVVEATTEMETVVDRGPPVGEPVLLQLEIQSVNDGQAVSVENNRLTTFVGHSVSYSFTLGGPPDGVSVRLQFTPLRIVGEIAEIEVELTGKLPRDGSLQMISRTEQWIASRGARSAFPFESGDPPSGYRFLVTPTF